MLLALQHGIDSVSVYPRSARGLLVFVGNRPNWLVQHSGPFYQEQLGSWVLRFLRRGDARGGLLWKMEGLQKLLRQRGDEAALKTY